MDLVRAAIGTSRKDQLVAAPATACLQFLRFMVDPQKAEGTQADFTLSLTGEAGVQRVILRNGAMLTEATEAKGAIHAEISPEDLADLVLGNRLFADLAPELAGFDAALDRSHLVQLPVGLGDILSGPAERERLMGQGEQ